MRRFILIAVLVGIMAALLANTALAAVPAIPALQGFGPGSGMRMWSADETRPDDADWPCGMTTGGMLRRGAPEWAGASEEVLTLLDMTAQDLRAERLAGKSLAQIAADKGVSEDTLIAAILGAKQANLAQLVADGKITQAQMDAMLQHMQAQIRVMVERTDVGPAFGQGQGRPGGTTPALRSGVSVGRGQGFRGGRGPTR